MRYCVTCAALVLALFSPHTKAVGPFDGIWTIIFQNTLIGYMTAHENHETLIVGVLGTDLTWNALQGPRTGTNFTVSSIAVGISAQYSGTFTSDTTFEATQLSCVALTDVCLLPDGATIRGDKIW
jgi:hypothetical protein